MPARPMRDPSPLRTTLAHSAMGCLCLGLTCGALGGFIHLTGDADAAGPATRLALFDTPGQDIALADVRLRTDRPAAISTPSMGGMDASINPQVADLGVDY
ncbi:MAG: hypothetical protein AAGF20_07470, partial [Pseudomonadota bacterium]